MTTEAVLLNSGGIDSRVAGWMMHRMGWELHSLHIPFNPFNRQACRNAALVTATLYCKTHVVAAEPDDWMRPYWGARKGWPHTGVYVHLMGAIYAEYRGIGHVVSGLRRDVMAEDWRPHMISLLAASRVSDSAVLVMPLLEEIAPDAGIRRAEELGVDVSDTHSCWIDPPCGECAKCEARRALCAA